MQTYILALDCETCGERMDNRIGDITADPGAELVIHVDLAVSQTTWNCSNCGGVTYSGDFEDMCEHEPGEERDLAEDWVDSQHGDEAEDEDPA